MQWHTWWWEKSYRQTLTPPADCHLFCYPSAELPTLFLNNQMTAMLCNKISFKHYINRCILNSRWLRSVSRHILIIGYKSRLCSWNDSRSYRLDSILDVVSSFVVYYLLARLVCWVHRVTEYCSAKVKHCLVTAISQGCVNMFWAFATCVGISDW